MAGVGLNLIVLKTAALDRLRDFYAALGIQFVQEQHAGDPLHYSAQLGSVVLELYPLPPGAGQPDATTRLGFTVPDLEAVLRSLPAAGSAVASEAKEMAWGKRAVVRDPDGRAVELYQQR
jgi:catechol 2,3-dioxygenase-like lactoylglutathione lyase family enzyme